MRNPATVRQWRNERFIEFVVAEVFFFIEQTFLFSRLVNCATARSERGKSCREKRSLPDPDLGFCMFCQKSRQIDKPIRCRCEPAPSNSRSAVSLDEISSKRDGWNSQFGSCDLKRSFLSCK